VRTDPRVTEALDAVVAINKLEVPRNRVLGRRAGRVERSAKKTFRPERFRNGRSV